MRSTSYTPVIYFATAVAAVYEDEKKLAMGNLSNVECLLCDV